MTDIKYRSLGHLGLPKITTSIVRNRQLIYTSIASSTNAATIKVQLGLWVVVRADLHDLQYLQCNGGCWAGPRTHAYPRVDVQSEH